MSVLVPLLALIAPAALPPSAPPPAVSATAPAAAPGARRPAAEASRKVRSAVERGAALLLDMQESLDEDPTGRKRSRERANGEPGGEWPYQGVYRVRGGEIPIGYRVGGTAIAGWVLCELPEWDEHPERAAAVGRAAAFVLEGLEHELMQPEKLSAYDVRGWGHAYALRFLLRLRELDRVPPELYGEVEARIPWLVDALETMEIANHGGWNYARRRGDDSAPSTFMTAATLQALFAARAAGEEVDAEVVERALAMLERSRAPSGSFQYAQRVPRDKNTGEVVPLTEDEPTQGAIGRMPICETTLLLAGRGDVERVRAALDDFFEHWQYLEDRRQKTGTHLPPYGVAPYYFCFAHGYAGQAIEMLEEDDRERYRERLHKLLWKVRERKTGGWNDRVFARSENFGTAMALFALWAPYMPEPPAWRAPAVETGPGSGAPAGPASGAAGTSGPAGSTGAGGEG